MAHAPSDPSAKLPRPRPGSWLDKSARRVEELLEERYGMTSFDSKDSYRNYARQILEMRAYVAAQAGISEASAQRYIDEKALATLADRNAVDLVNEKPGTEPFGDEEVVDVPLAVWSRMILSLQLAVRAIHEKNPEYAISTMMVAVSMVTVIVAEAEAGRAGETLSSPRAGTTYAARMATVASETLAEIGEGDVGGIPFETIVTGLVSDAIALREYLG